MEISPKALVGKANEEISILYVCDLLGMYVPSFDTKSVKVHCPFGSIYHDDGGLETAFRIYPGSNSAFCFAGCGFFSPVSLYAQARDLPPETAAGDLLDLTGIAYSTTYLEDFERLRALTAPLDTTALGEALKVYCASVSPQWETLQFTQQVAEVLDKCLSFLPRVTTDSEAEHWLQTTKLVMLRAVTRNLTPDLLHFRAPEA